VTLRRIGRAAAFTAVVVLAAGCGGGGKLQSQLKDATACLNSSGATTSVESSGSVTIYHIVFADGGTQDISFQGTTPQFGVDSGLSSRNQRLLDRCTS
jgi:ABC-type glycerol-3-phosphate transport system substrate-binding protein